MNVEPNAKALPRVEEALADDLNTAGAITELHRIYEAIRNSKAIAAGAKNILNVPDDLFLAAKEIDASDPTVALRTGFTASARLLGLLEPGFGQWLEVGTDEDHLVRKLEELKNTARSAKNYALADEIRQEMLQIGIIAKDGPNGFEFEVDHKPAHRAVSANLKSVSGELLFYSISKLPEWRSARLTEMIEKYS